MTVGRRPLTVSADVPDILAAALFVPRKTALKLWAPIPGRSFRAAFPEGVNCAVPNRWISVQYFAEASQKFTCPVVTGTAPAWTEAVRVITLPEVTVVTVLPPEVSTRDVVVEGFACADATIQGAKIATRHARRGKVGLPGKHA